MGTQNYASTAAYFERRAGKALSFRRKELLEATAAHYRSLAKEFGHQSLPAEPAESSEAVIPPRRKRLMELFRTHGNAPV